MNTRKITEFGLLLAVSLVLAYFESLLPVMIAVPGVKLGIANIVTMLILYRWGMKQAFFFMTLRIVMAGFLFSGITGILYSFAGGVFCIIAMSVMKKISFFSKMGVSMAGAVFHNLGQILIAVIVMENAHILYYFPVLCLTGLISGFAVGYISTLLIKWFELMFPKEL
ncbi:MAG: Gx transporter family protein [Lachnospiraceae bacterium]|nr:Gx transporter family protein [Lachnospiraceae bacterium]